MKMTKRGLAVLLALCMIFSFACCAIAEDVASEQTEVSNVTEEQTEVAAAADEASEAPAAEEEAAAEEEEAADEAAAAEEEAADEEAADEAAASEEEAADEAAAEEEAADEEAADEAAAEEEAAEEEAADEAAAEEEAAEEEAADEAAAEEEEAADEAADEDGLVVIEDEQTPLGVGGNTASALPGAESGVPTQASPFTANVRVKMVSGSEIYFGDTVTLAAVVDGASAEYTIRWEYSDGGAWTPCGTGETYSFVVNETNALYTFRAVAVERLADAA